ncbi:MAG: universal stress protein [Sinobacteraceae bacterium]|nr:universal stress protein [Nevskiaceae bacterium]
MLARHLDASIDIFLCDTDHAWAVREQAHSAEARAIVAACHAENERFLQALRGSVPATDLRITLSFACAFAVHEGLAERVEQLQPMLVIKSLANSREGRARPPQPAEMQIIRSCRVPLLLSQGHQWQPVPRFCATLDVNARDEVASRSILLTTAQLARECHGVWAVGLLRDPQDRRSEPMSDDVQARWRDLAPQSVHAVSGSPLEGIADLVHQQRIDLLVLGEGIRLSPRATEAGLAEQVVGRVTCDLLVVPRDPDRSVAALPIPTNTAYREPGKTSHHGH